MTTTPELHVPLAAGDLRLEPLAEAHREPLRTVWQSISEAW